MPPISTAKKIAKKKKKVLKIQSKHNGESFEPQPSKRPSGKSRDSGVSQVGPTGLAHVQEQDDLEEADALDMDEQPKSRDGIKPSNLRRRTRPRDEPLGDEWLQVPGYYPSASPRSSSKGRGISSS